MKTKKLNITSLIVFLLFSAFSVSLTHTIIEQMGTGCEQHESHDFAKVIVNASLRNSNEDNSGNNKLIDCFIIPSGICYYESILPQISKLHYSVPLLYYDKLYLTKTGTLLI